MDDQAQVARALEATEAVVTSVNESVRASENLERLRSLSEELWIGGEGYVLQAESTFFCSLIPFDKDRRLDLTAPTAFMGSRQLIKEATVSKAKSGRRLQIILCNDILVLIESRNLYRMVSLVKAAVGFKRR